MSWILKTSMGILLLTPLSISLSTCGESFELSEKMSTMALAALSASMISSLHSLPGAMFLGAIQQGNPAFSTASQTAFAA